MIRIRSGIVKNILRVRPGICELTVEVEGKLERAVNYQELTGPVQPGDQVVLNTTAVSKGLGTGGTHFVMAVSGCAKKDAAEAGHIMKVRYTPAQVKVLSIEEKEHPLNYLFRKTPSLAGTPVIICSLHSMVGPVAAVIARLCGDRAKLAYVMTDGASLPIAFSRQVADLKEKGLLSSTVTCGHAFGGDIEAVNIYSGLLAAKGAAGAGIIIASMGPGIVGTDSEFGHTGLEQGELANAVGVLGGRAVAVPRVSFADQRERHKGLSHHTQTALGKVALVPCVVPFAQIEEEKKAFITRQLVESGIQDMHSVVFLDASMTMQAIANSGLAVSTMGRNQEQDPEFFLTAGAAGIYAVSLLNNSGDASL
ncbi:MAG: DUF3866 family protein [Eubacteriales bacterium]